MQPILSLIVALLVLQSAAGQFDFSGADDLGQIQNGGGFNQPPLGQNNPGLPNNGRPNVVTLAPVTTTTALPERYFRCTERCAVTSEYSPVCGNNDQTYHNLSRLRCAQSCGLNVTLRRNGPCKGRGGR